MRLKLFLLIGLSLLIPGAVVLSASAPLPELVIYTYDSFVAKGGAGPEIFPLFEKQCGCKIKALASGDGAQLLNRLQLNSERGKSEAQIALGIDQQLWGRALPLMESPGQWLPAGYEQLVPDAVIGGGFVPYDYGVFALMADRDALRALHLDAPRRISDLLKPEYRRNFILEDPRTSTPGLAFLLLTQTVLGDGAWNFWSKLKSQWLTLAPGWDGAYGLFLKKEAPLVWSYTTSQAYHVEHGDREGRYQALLFDEGQPIQIEGAAIVRGGVSKPGALGLARDFLSFLITPEIQKRIALKNWMLPVLRGFPLPESFKGLPQAKKLYRIQTSAQDIGDSLKRWAQSVQGAGPGS